MLHKVAQRELSLQLSEKERSYEDLHKRFTAYKRSQEEVDSLHLDKKVKEQKKWILMLEAELTASRARWFICIHSWPRLGL